MGSKADRQGQMLSATFSRCRDLYILLCYFKNLTLEHEFTKMLRKKTTQLLKSIIRIKPYHWEGKKRALGATVLLNSVTKTKTAVNLQKGRERRFSS